MGVVRIDRLRIREMSARVFVEMITGMRFFDERQRVGPGQGGAFAVDLERGLAPGVEQMEA